MRSIKDLPSEHGHCGLIKRIFQDDNVSFVYLNVSQAAEHYHRDTTEYYLVTRGSGKIMLNDEVFGISTGDFIEIPPNTRHKAFDENELEILVVMIPPLSPEDNYFVS